MPASVLIALTTHLLGSFEANARIWPLSWGGASSFKGNMQVIDLNWSIHGHPPSAFSCTFLLEVNDVVSLHGMISSVNCWGAFSLEQDVDDAHLMQARRGMISSVVTRPVHPNAVPLHSMAIGGKLRYF